MPAPDQIEQSSSAPPRRQQQRRDSLFILFAGIFVFVAIAGALYFALRPETLRIAVGPPGSDDQKLIQLLAQTFARQHNSIRLAPISTEGAVESVALLAASKTDMAVARGDLDMPADAQSVAILRKNVVVLWAPSGLPAKGSKKTPTPKIKSLDDLQGHRVAVIGRTQANVTLLRVILSESGIAPDKVTVVQFAHQSDQRNGPRSDHRCLHGGGTAGQQDYRRRHRRDRARAGRTQISSHRCIRGDCPEASSCMNPRKFPEAPSVRRRRGRTTRSRPSASTI